MPWQAGQSGNPSGRPARGKAIAETLNRVLDEPWQDGEQTKRERLCRHMVASACEGNMKAAGWVADRAEGRPVVMNSEPGSFIGPIRILDFGESVPDEEEEEG